MNIFKSLIDDCKALRDGKAGSRFRDYANKRRERRGGSMTFGRALSIAFALLLIIVGLGIGWLPGPGGFLAIIGLALIAKEIPLVALMLDRIELFGRRLLRNCRKLVCRSAIRRGPESDSKGGTLKISNP